MNFIVRNLEIKFYLIILLLVYMDNQTLCNEGIIHLENVYIGRIYSHIDYHVNKYNKKKFTKKKYFIFFFCRINIFILKIIIVQ
jgi:hypothetical protein